MSRSKQTRPRSLLMSCLNVPGRSQPALRAARCGHEHSDEYKHSYEYKHSDEYKQAGRSLGRSLNHSI